ncbi:MAG: pyruvate dehydrogenase (acetyl-transferring) E1 component subunit alpha [Candidatus Micrarchaeaceae archaeon]|nr:pyruvate dehydrogenase (acetyl-transferring) E1 component subunit alpha [Candidatus Micrarchaeota archaeon]HII09998.1 pyruvate dehydrogenase (acetyl-transferring) E1 component subunit alpha [Candidatus Micrarchaeota archaeon]
MLKSVFEGNVNYLQVLDENGEVDVTLFPSDLKDEQVVEMYRQMCFARAMDAKVLSLQRQGRAVTYAPLIGEEATQVGSALAMRDGDYFVPNFRQHAVFAARGMPLDLILIYWRGYEEGLAIPESVKALPYIVPVASQLPHAAGIAFSQRYNKTDNATITYVGDGGTSQGDFYETLNFAGVFKLPLVTIIENNQWAISVPRSRQSAAQTLAQKGFAAGMDVVQVDGNDVIAVYKAVKDALEISKEAPTLIECVTYRMGMHTTADDPTKYRSEDEVAEWRMKDPISRLKKYLVKKALWNDGLEETMQEGQKKTIDAALEKAEAFKPDPKSIFEHVYSYMPDVLKEELDAAVESNFYEE